MKILVLLALLGTVLHETTAGGHSLKYFYTGSSGLPDFPEFVSVGYVDDVQMFHYDSNTRRAEPRQDWMSRMTADDPKYWESQTDISQGFQQNFRVNTENLKQRFNQTGGQERQLLGEQGRGPTDPCPDQPFPPIVIRPGPEEHKEVSLEKADGKVLSAVMVRTLNRQRLEQRTRSPWRARLALGEEVQAEWRSLYKPPLSKRVADLQWRLFYGILAVNSFISVLNSAVSSSCPFCGAVENIIHCFAECPRLAPLFSLLDHLFRRVEEVFSLKTFILGFKYKRAHKDKCQLINFILGQAKMAVYVSRKRKVEDGVDCDVVLLLSRSVRARVLIDFNFYRQMQDLEDFIRIWTYGGALCSVKGNELEFSDQLV